MLSSVTGGVGLARSRRRRRLTFDDLGSVISELDVQRVFLIPTSADNEMMLDAVRRTAALGVKQRRVGRDGGAFQMIKFRSMVDGAEAQRAALQSRNETAGLFKLTADPRVTRVGRLLRRSSIDELTQLLNVVRGEMSLVGPGR